MQSWGNDGILDQRILMKYDLIFDVKWGMQMEHETDNKDKESLR